MLTAWFVLTAKNITMKRIIISIILGLGFLLASCQEGRIDPYEQIDWRDFQKTIFQDSVLAGYGYGVDSTSVDSFAVHRTAIDGNVDSLAIHRTAIDINTALNVQSAFEILWLQDSVDVHRIQLNALMDSIAVLRALH